MRVNNCLTNSRPSPREAPVTTKTALGSKLRVCAAAVVVVVVKSISGNTGVPCVPGGSGGSKLFFVVPVDEEASRNGPFGVRLWELVGVNAHAVVPPKVCTTKATQDRRNESANRFMLPECDNGFSGVVFTTSRSTEGQ